MNTTPLDALKRADTLCISTDRFKVTVYFGAIRNDDAANEAIRLILESFSLALFESETSDFAHLHEVGSVQDNDRADTSCAYLENSGYTNSSNL